MMSEIKFLDLSKQQKIIEKKLKSNLDKVLSESKYIMGPQVIELENSLQEYTKINYCVTCSSGTDGLILALLALDIKQDDIVICPSFTFPATAESILMVGATPVFVDVGENTFNICHKKLIDTIELCKKKKLNIKAIMPVDLYGLPSNYDKLNEIAKVYNFHIVSDAAQSFGAIYKNKKVGKLTEITTTSFFPAKPLGCYGDGGAVFTEDFNIKEKLESLRAHGKGKGKYDINYMGMNARLDTIQAAVLLSKLDIFDWEIKERNRIASIYSNELKNILDVPIVPKNTTSVWAQYTLKSNKREKIISYLKENNIPAMIYYPKPMHEQTAYKKFNLNAGLDVSTALSKKVFSIPVHAYLSELHIEYIIEKLKKAKKLFL